MACIFTTNDDFKAFPTPLSSKSLKYDNYVKAPYIVSSYHQSQSKPQSSPHLLPHAELNSPNFPSTHKQRHFKVHFLHESELQLGKTMILQKKIDFAWNPQHLRHSVRRMFF